MIPSLAEHAKRSTTVQTFLPYPSYVKSAACLDPTRLLNQRNEATVILNAVLEQKYYGVSAADVPWGNHPATRMWLDYPSALVRYAFCICLECKARDFDDSVLDKIATLQKEHRLYSPEEPWWLGLPALHSSHRSNLTIKWPHWYVAFKWTEFGQPIKPYFWPVSTPPPKLKFDV